MNSVTSIHKNILAGFIWMVGNIDGSFAGNKTFLQKDFLEFINARTSESSGINS
jgi:hypothetical protein